MTTITNTRRIDMSHEITIRDDGFAEAVYARTPGWHLKGKTIKDRDLVEEDMIPFIDFDPEMVSLYRQVAPGQFQLFESAKGIIRSDNGHELSHVSPYYVPWGHLKAFPLLNSLMMDGIMKYEAAFTLRGGKDVVIVAQIPGKHEVAEGDVNLPFIMCLFNHTGQHRVRFLPTAIRPVCANTVALALSQGKGQILSVRHSGDMELKMDKVRIALSEINSAFTSYTEVARKLSKIKITKPKWQEYLDVLFPVLPITDSEFSTRKRNKALETRRQVYHNALNDPAQQIPSTRHSWYAGFNAVTQWVDHHEHKGKNETTKAETKFRVANLGTGNDLKVKALHHAVRLSSTN